MSEELPKQELLKKILGQTTSDNDNVALMAMRKANELLREAGWDWNRLIDGKIRVAENPFANLKRPPMSASIKPTHVPEPDDYDPPAKQPAPPPRPKPQTWTDLDGNTHTSQNDCNLANQAITARRKAAAAKTVQAGMPTIGSSHVNKFANNCHCCGTWVDQHLGFIFKPASHKGVTNWPTSKWAVVCKPCNNDPNLTVRGVAAPKKGGPATLADLA